MSMTPDQAVRRLQKWAKNEAPAEIMGKMNIIAALMERNSKTRCPVDTGRLRSSISSTAQQQGDDFIAAVYTGVDYAVFVHEGTRYQRKQPFMRNGVEAALSQIEAVLRT